MVISNICCGSDAVGVPRKRSNCGSSPVSSGVCLGWVHFSTVVLEGVKKRDCQPVVQTWSVDFYVSEICAIAVCQWWLLYIFSNVCHGSDSIEGAKKEIDLWFKPEEIMEYEANSKPWVYEWISFYIAQVHVIVTSPCLHIVHSLPVVCVRLTLPPSVSKSGVENLRLRCKICLCSVQNPFCWTES